MWERAGKAAEGVKVGGSWEGLGGRAPKREAKEREGEYVEVVAGVFLLCGCDCCGGRRGGCVEGGKGGEGR